MIVLRTAMAHSSRSRTGPTILETKRCYNAQMATATEAGLACTVVTVVRQAIATPAAARVAAGSILAYLLAFQRAIILFTLVNIYNADKLQNAPASLTVDKIVDAKYSMMFLTLLHHVEIARSNDQGAPYFDSWSFCCTLRSHGALAVSESTYEIESTHPGSILGVAIFPGSGYTSAMKMPAVKIQRQL